MVEKERRRRSDDFARGYYLGILHILLANPEILELMGEETDGKADYLYEEDTIKRAMKLVNLK